MRHHGFLVVLSAAGIAGVAWFANQHSDLSASEESNRSFREAFAGSEEPTLLEEEDGVRLNFFDAKWDAVLREVAHDARLTLVMDKIPHGRFARRDRKRYKPESAIRVLNAELEQQGFRLVQQGRHLIVLKLDQVRSRYARPVLNKPAQSEWQSAGTPPGQTTLFGKQPTANPFQTAAARTDETKPSVTWASEPASQQAQVGDSGQQPFGDLVKPATAPQTQHEPDADQGPMQVQKISILNAKAAEVARSIYLVFESRAELVREGLDGLPTFVVNDKPVGSKEASKPLFRIGIDQPNNKLLIEASRVRGQHLTKLVQELDKPEIVAGETVKLVPNKGVSESTAKDLNKQIHRMVAMRAQAGQLPPMAGDGPTSSTSDEGTLNLRGEVNVQAMQDLGILILKGNEADVEKVSKIIEQLETMSVGSLPGIHVLFLNNVNSEAMAELMTQVYEELAAVKARGGDTDKEASFIPVVKPNAILILAPEIDLPSIKELADQLDTQVDPESEFKVFSLRNAIASQVSASITTFYEERGGLGTRVRVIADARTNAVIVQGRMNDLEEVSKLVEKMDKDEPGSVHRVEIVQLRHATAEELTDTINNAIQSAINAAPQPTTGGQGGFGGAGAQANQDLQGTKSVALEFLSTTEGGRELLRSGILADVRINPDPRTNNLVVSAPEASMPLLLALIEQLDQPPTAVSEIKVFALKNADAEQSVELLGTLFENQNQEDQLGIVIAGAEDAASSLVPVVFSADLRTNTVLAVGSPETLSVVEAILLRLDTTESRERTTNVMVLRNALASDVAEALDDFLQQQSDLQDASEGLLSNIERLRKGVIVAADNNSNSLIVSASPEYYSQISQIVQELDATPPEVIIQALIVEVQLDNTDEFGVELGFQDPTLFSRSILSSVADIVTTTETNTLPNGTQTTTTNIESRNPTPGFNFNNTVSALGNNSSGDTSIVGTQGISNFSLGRQNGDLGFGGFVFSAQSDAVSVLVRALAARRTVHVLSRPQIRATNNQPARMEVGQLVPVVNGVTVTDNFVTPDIQQQSVGINLQVTPRVTADGTVNMSVFAEKSALAPGGVPVFTDVTTGNVVESVIINSAIAETVVAVPNGQTIVIGGMITKSDETLERKVPWLGDLPIIGSAFRYDGTNTARSELLIFLTPRVIYNDIDAEVIKQIESERLHFIESEAEEMHGPIFSVPPSELEALSQPSMNGQYFEQPVGPAIGQPVPDQTIPVPEEPSVVLPPQARRTSPRASTTKSITRQEFDSRNGPAIQPASGTKTDNSKVKTALEKQFDVPEQKDKKSWVNRFLRNN